MSAYLTHLSFGLKNYKCMDEGEVKSCISLHRHAYFYGLAGPDIFFYNLFHIPFGQKKAGCMIHDHRSGAFIENMCLSLQKLFGEKKEIGIAYLAGFICHYEIDAATHPYVYDILDEKSGLKSAGRHFELEAAYDVYASVSMLAKLPSGIKQNRILSLTSLEKEVVTGLITRAYTKTFSKDAKGIYKVLPAVCNPYHMTRLEMKATFLCTYFAVTVLHDRFAVAEKALRFLEKFFIGHSVLSALFCNDEVYDLTIGNWAVYRNLCEDGLLETLKVMDRYEKWCLSSSCVNREKLMQVVGNKSYHTGKELEEE